jgi:hypothetical protein
MGPTHPPTKSIRGPLSPGVKWPEREAEHLTLSSAEVKNDDVPPFPHTSSWRGAQLIKHKGFTFTCTSI